MAVTAWLCPALAGLALAACATVGPAATAPVLNSSATVARSDSPVPLSATLAPTATAAPPVSDTPTAEPPTPAVSATAPAPAPATVTPTVPPVVQFMAVGDLMLGRSVGDRILSQGSDTVFGGVAATLAQADLLVANLECVISDQGSPQFKSFNFRAPLSAVDALSSAGFDVVSLANNHSMDYGIDGLADTVTRLRAAGISSVGAGADAETARAPVILARNGVHVAFLSYVNVPIEGRTGFDTRNWAAGVEKPGVAWAEPEAIAADVAAAKTVADVVVVLLHTGLESRFEVSPSQRDLAHAAVDAGAALVLGAHSHTLQPVERYKSGLIAYSLGNFVFDGFTALSNYTAIFSATLTPVGVESYRWIPVVVMYGLPRLATSDEAALILPLVREQ